MKSSIALVIFLALAVSVTTGQYELEKFVIASGGGPSSSGGEYSLVVTTAQPVAGGFFQSNPYSTYHGFWVPGFTPTAAHVSVSGRVRTAEERGIAYAVVTLTAISGATQRALTTPFGFFRFDNVAVGESYIVSVSSKTYQFEPRYISVVDEVTDLEMVAIE